MTPGSDPIPTVDGLSLGSSETSLFKILEVITTLFQAAQSGGIPVQLGGGGSLGFTDFVTSGGPVSCASSPSSVVIGDSSKYNQFNIVSVMFDNSTLRDVAISILIGGQVRTWIPLPAYAGSFLLLTDSVEGQGFQLQLDVSEYAGSYTYMVTGKER